MSSNKTAIIFDTNILIKNKNDAEKYDCLAAETYDKCQELIELNDIQDIELKKHPRIRQYLIAIREGLVRDVAGDEGSLSEQQRIIIDRIRSCSIKGDQKYIQRFILTALRK